MTRSIRKWWLDPTLIIRGAEGEGEGTSESGTGSSGDSSTNGETGSDTSNTGDGESDDDDDDDDKSTFTKEDVQGLKNALREERKARKLAERANKAKEKDQSDAEAKDEAEKTANRLKAAEEKATRLASGYREARVESTITRLAQDANVIAPDDMVALLKAQGFKDIEIDQDEDDPSQVEIDEDDVKAAIKKALKTRPHWTKKSDDGDEEEPPSGSKMRPGKPRKSGLDDEGLKAAYPALRARR